MMWKGRSRSPLYPAGLRKCSNSHYRFVAPRQIVAFFGENLLVNVLLEVASVNVSIS